MSVLAWDVETTGLPKWNLRSDDPIQPRIVQMAIVTYDDAGIELSARSIIVKPQGWVIPADMTAIHGISQERAADEGIPEKEMIDLWIEAQAQASLRVAHNSRFDVRLARISMLRSGYPRAFIEAIEARPDFCTCENAKPLVKAPMTQKQIAAGFSGFKSPNLQECMTAFFGEQIDGAHDALVDARCSGRIYFHIVQKVNA